MNCPACGSELPATAKFCGSCGHQFAAPSAVATRAPQMGSVTGGAMTAVRSYDEIAQSPANIGVGEVLSEGWDLTKANFGLVLGGIIVVGLIMGVAGMVPFGSLIIGGPLTGGLCAVALRIAAGRGAEFGNFFDGFKRFVPLMLVQLVTGLLVGVGMVFLLLPGLYLAMAFSFATYLVVDRNEEFWPAMMASMKVVNANFGLMAMWLLAMCGLAFVGVLTCGLGFVAIAPLMAMSSAVLYKHIFGIAGGAEQMAAG